MEGVVLAAPGQDCFIKADADGNGLLDTEEFDEMIKDTRAGQGPTYL